MYTHLKIIHHNSLCNKYRKMFTGNTWLPWVNNKQVITITKIKQFRKRIKLIIIYLNETSLDV